MNDKHYIGGERGLNSYLETKQITRFNFEEPWGWYIKPQKK